MGKIQNVFVKSIVDNDSDERITENDLIGTPQNISIYPSTGNNRGVLKNVPGNVKKTNYGIAGAETIGKGKDESNENVYNFIKGTSYDYVIEYNTTTNSSQVVLQSSTGGVLNFRSGERITNFNLFVNSENGEITIFWCGDSNPPRCVNVTTAKTWAIDGFTNDEISVMKPSPIFAPTTALTTSVDGVENNFIEDKFLCFGYRYKYSDGYYSAPSSWSKVAFTPRAFSLDYQTYENNGMLNLSNAVDIGFNVGPRDVVQVDLLFRESNSTTVYVIQQFVKADEGWGDNTAQMFQFSKAKIYTVLAEDQFFRNFDNVPLSANCQTVIGSRIAYANYVEGRDLGVIIDFDVDYITEDVFSSTIDGTRGDFVDSEDYSNVSDFEVGTEIGGTTPIDQMDYNTNTVIVDLAGAGATNAYFSYQVTPKADYLSTVYDVTFKNGATVVASYTGQVGINTFGYITSSNENIQIYVTSDEGLIYDGDLNYQLKAIGVLISEYQYLANSQLSFPKSGGYGPTLVGDTIILHKATFDMSGYSFKANTQIRINMKLFSSLEPLSQPIVSFFYALTQDYVDLTDFLTNSDFNYQLETVFSLYFQNNWISNAGTLVSYTGFQVEQLGDLLKVVMPKVVYDVTEPVGIEQKVEFYLITETALQTTNADAFASLHSNRDYEVGLIYMDEQGRKTTVLVSANNTVYVPASNSDLITKLQVTINNNPPSWAKYYKFLIKQTKKSYEIIYGNVVYKDGLYRWIKLVGENKNKVNTGDILTLKSDYDGPLNELRKVKVLEVTNQATNFITGNVQSDGNEIIEEGGLYFKIKQGDFNINIEGDSYKTFLGYGISDRVQTDPNMGFIDDTNTYVPYTIGAGTFMSMNINVKQILTGSGNFTFTIETSAQADYANIKEWFDAEVAPTSNWSNFVTDADLVDYGFDTDVKYFFVETQTSFYGIGITINANFSQGTLVFETEPIEQLESSFFETPNVYTISGGHHQFTTHVLNDAFNCFAFGNGVESFKIKDALNGKSFSIDSNPNDINKEGYKQITRYADITYSENYEQSTNVNRLNEFNLSLANYKDDIQKDWGPINVMKGFDTNLEIIQEDKYSVVYYGKDLLYNADGTTNLSGIPQVLGQQRALDGEYGCQNIDSFDFYGFNRYFADVKRGTILKKSNNGLFEISNQGMRAYFKKLFRDNVINNIITEYDQFNDVCIMCIQYNSDQFVTWLYSDVANGWLTTHSFNPEDMARVNGAFYSFKNGEIYLHNDENAYNTFYGTLFPSIFSFNFSQSPSSRKIFKTIEQEGNHPWAITALTNLNTGYVNESDFEKKEGFYYAYLRGQNGQVNTALLNYQGIGVATAMSLTLNLADGVPEIVSVGDLVVNTNLQLIGTILSKTSNSLTLDAVNNFTNGDFVLCQKPESVQSQGILGYYLRVTAETTTNQPIELFAVNSEISISNPT